MRDILAGMYFCLCVFFLSLTLSCWTDSASSCSGDGPMFFYPVLSLVFFIQTIAQLFAKGLK